MEYITEFFCRNSIELHTMICTMKSTKANKNKTRFDY